MPDEYKDYKVQVKLTSGRTVRIPVGAWTDTRELCQKVAKVENAPAEIITLKCDCEETEDTVIFLRRGYTLKSCGVREDVLLKVQLLTKETLNVHLHLPGTPEEIISIEIYNTSCHSEIETKLKAANSFFARPRMSFHIRNMKLNTYRGYAYEDCIQDGDHIYVRCPAWEREKERQRLTKETLNVHLHLPGTPEEIISIEIYNTSFNSEIETKAIAARPLLARKYMSFHIGDMELNNDNCAYEDCIQDGDHIMVKCPTWECEDKEKQELLKNLASSMTSQRKVDIVFSFDTSGSMNDILHIVHKSVRESVTRLMSDIPNIRIGLIAHSDYSDEYRYVLKKHKISSNKAKLVKFVDKTAGSFADRPFSFWAVAEEGEGSTDKSDFACYEWVLRKANGLSWREDAAKALVIIGDVVPHPTSYTNLKINWRDELDKLCEKGVKVYGVQDIHGNTAKCFYAYMAKKSGGGHISFHNFSWITDMLIAVWYRASGDDQLKAYVDKVKNEGRMTDEMMDVLRLLEKKPEEEAKDEEKEEEKKEEEEDEEEAATETGGEEAEITQSSPRRPQEEELHGRRWDHDLRKHVPVGWWDATLDQADSATYNYIYCMSYWTRNGKYRIYNLGPVLRTSFRLKTLWRGFSLL